MSQQYSLRWNNHQPNFISMFTSLLNTQTLVDVTLSAEGKQLLAHKVVLSACSTYFQSLFVDNPSPHPIVILKDVTYADLRTMVDFMYCGVVNVTEEQLPKVLDTAKLLKIKGLTEMPDSTSLTRAQSDRNGTEQADSLDSQRESPAESQSKKKRRRKSSTGSNAVMVENDGRTEASAQTIEPITFSSVPQRRYNEIRTIDNSQQTQETAETAESMEMVENQQAQVQGLWTAVENTYNPRYTNACLGAGMLQSETGMPYIASVASTPQQDMHYVQTVDMTEPSPGPSTSCGEAKAQQPQLQRINRIVNRRKRATNPQSEENFQRALEAVRFGGSGSGEGNRQRRSKLFKRQARVPDSEVRKQCSEPAAAPARAPPLLKHDSYPQYTAHKGPQSRKPRPEHEAGALLVRALPAGGASAGGAGSGGADAAGAGAEGATPRASHTPAVRSGPPLSCNFCWNTVDECGRILRRKTQYHCPECRTNLCIVPCFHEYHDGPESDSNSNAR